MSSLWDTLPVEVQDKILLTAAKLIYDDTVKHFRLIVGSIDARLAAHYNVAKAEQYRSKSTVFCQTYEREYRYNNYSYIRNGHNQPESYSELQITLPGDSFGDKSIDRVYEGRGRQALGRENDPNMMPLVFVLQGCKTRDITIDHLQSLLRTNKVKFLKKDNKGVLVRKFMAIT